MMGLIGIWLVMISGALMRHFNKGWNFWWLIPFVIGVCFINYWKYFVED